MTTPTAEHVLTWTPTASDGYDADAAPSASTCNAFLAEAVAVLDMLCGGTDAMSADRAIYVLPTRTVGTETAVVLGNRISAAIDQGALTGTDDRTTYILALTQACRRMARETQGTPADRSAGVPWVPIAVGAVVVVVVGLAAAWWAARTSDADRASRTVEAGILAASRDYAEQVRVSAQTGQPVAAPTPIMVAAAESVRAAASQARADGIGQQIAQAAGSLTLLIAAGMAAWFVVQNARKG